MKDFFVSNKWNVFIIVVLGVVAAFTRELVTYAMLGYVLIIMSNIYDKLDEISRQLGGNNHGNGYNHEEGERNE